MEKQMDKDDENKPAFAGRLMILYYAEKQNGEVYGTESIRAETYGFL